MVKFIRAHIQALHWIFEHQADTVEFLNKEFGLPTQYARRGIEYYTKNKVYPINGDVTLSGLKVNIEVQAQDGIIKPRCRRRKNTSISAISGKRRKNWVYERSNFARPACREIFIRARFETRHLMQSIRGLPRALVLLGANGAGRFFIRREN